MVGFWEECKQKKKILDRMQRQGSQYGDYGLDTIRRARIVSAGVISESGDPERTMGQIGLDECE